MKKKGGPRGVKQPKNITVKRIYEPDMQAMVRALKIVLEWNPKNQKEEKKGA